VLRRTDSDAGYASLTAVILCTAVSILCAGAISLSATNRNAEAKEFERVRREEAINSAVMQFAADIVASDQSYEVRGEKTIVTTNDSRKVRLVGQLEFAKWPVDQASRVNRAALAKVTWLSGGDLELRIKTGNRDDCVATLFSNLGQADPDKDRMSEKSVLNPSTSKDGQVWRIRAVSGKRVEERRVRFLGDPDHLFALVSVNRMSLGEMPECTDLIAVK
jgi:hypothetical protein